MFVSTQETVLQKAYLDSYETPCIYKFYDNKAKQLFLLCSIVSEKNYWTYDLPTLELQPVYSMYKIIVGYLPETVIQILEFK